MQPRITRETIIDRRQPAIRWSAVFAGTAIAVGVWGVLQLIGFGVGLVALDPDNVSSFGPAAIGTTAFSTLAPLIAMFAGGWVAARVANTYDRHTAGAHGLITWGLSSVAGLVVTVVLATALGHNAARMERHEHGSARMETSRAADVDDAIAPINERLRVDGKPIISPEQLLQVARAANRNGYDRNRFIAKLDEMTALDKADATRVVDQLGERAPGIVTLAGKPTPHERAAVAAMEKAGKGLLALGVAMLLSVFTAIAGALVALRNEEHRRHPHTTAPYPITQPPTDDD